MARNSFLKMENSQFRWIFLNKYYLLKTKIKRILLVKVLKIPCFIARNHLEILFEMDSKFVIFMFCVIFMVQTGVRGETESKGKVRILLFIVVIVNYSTCSTQYGCPCLFSGGGVKLVLLLGQIIVNCSTCK
jgi:hypothetical protein